MCFTNRLLKIARLTRSFWRQAVGDTWRFLPSGQKLANFARFSCFQAHQPLGSPPSTCRHPQIAHPNQVVGCGSQHEVEVQLFTTHKPALAQSANGLEPAEAFFDPLADRLAGSVTGVAVAHLASGHGEPCAPNNPPPRRSRAGSTPSLAFCVS